jgi:two-component system cell cycle response regulator
VLRGAATARAFRIDKPTVTLGRGEESDARVVDEGVSRLHARLTVDGALVWVEDAGSTNKTFVNGEEVTGRRMLTEGDQIGLGSAALFRFEDRSAVEADIQRALFDRALRDPLTGAFRRQHFDERFRPEFSFAQRHRTALVVAVLGIDGLDAVVAAHGQLGREEALAHLGARLQREVGEHLLARYAADELAILARAAGPDAGRTIAERVRRAAEAAPFPVATAYLRLTVSVGVAAFPLPKVDMPGQLLAVAERALQEARARGPNRIVVAETGEGHARP